MNPKRVLIITYYWPPSGGIGVHRCLKFAKYLREYGWEPVILTALNAQYPVLDESNFRHIPPELEVHKVPIIEPFSIFKKLSGRKADESANPVYVRDRKRSSIDELAIWIRGNFFIPDARALWIRPAVSYLKKYIRENKIDAIFSDGPPHTNTRIAYHISRQTGIPWLADFQDPWTQVDYYSMLKISSRADKKHRKMEQDTFKQAAKITIASPTWAKDLEKIGASDVDVLYYGYDESDFTEAEEKIQKKEYSDSLKHLKDKFVINHPGMMGNDRNPFQMLQVTAEIASSDPAFKNDLLLFFPGEVDYEIRKNIEKLKLDNNTLLPGHISKAASVESLLLSSVQLLLLNKAENVKGRLPGKIYEYLRSYKPILALGPADSDVNEILLRTATGKCIDYSNKKELKEFLLSAYHQWKKNDNPEINRKEIQKFDVKVQTQKLSELLNDIVR